MRTHAIQLRIWSLIINGIKSEQGMIFLTYSGIQMVLIQVLGFTMQVVLSWLLSGKESACNAGDSKI